MWKKEKETEMPGMVAHTCLPRRLCSVDHVVLATLRKTKESKTKHV
jgi:hypothetical protein